MSEVTKLSPPWITYVNELKKLFGKDSQIEIVYDDDKHEIKLYVDDMNKSDALSSILPPVKTFGNVELHIDVIPSNKCVGYGSIIRSAFNNNPVVSDVIEVDTPFGMLCYLVFKKEVAQFFNDQVDDPHGLKSMLYQDIARDVLDSMSGVCYCTAVE